MDDSEQDQTASSPELSDSWMVINESPADEEKDNGEPSDGSDGESVEVIDQEEYNEVLTGETDYDTTPPIEEMIGPKNKKYVHHPNEDVNAALNRLMVIAASVVVGLAVGHYLGYAEEVSDIATTVKKLEAENIKLKNHICITMENYNNYIEYSTDNAYSELKHINEHYAVFFTVLLNITCPHMEAKTVGIQTALDELRQAVMKGHLSDDEVHDRIDKILKIRSSEHAVIDNINFSDKVIQTKEKSVTTQDTKLSATVPQVIETHKLREQSSEADAPTETLSFDTQEESTSKEEINEDLTRTNTIEGGHDNVHIHPKTTESTLLEKLIVANSLAKTPAKTSDGLQVATICKDSRINTEDDSKSVLKHIVKDAFQEITEPLVLQHGDIIRDVRDEAKKLLQSVPIFTSALLLNTEITSKLKSDLKYIKNTLNSILENNLDITNKGKHYDFLKNMNLHRLHLQKALDSLQLMEVSVNQKGGGLLNVQRSNVCAVSDFFKELYRKTPHNTETVECSRKHLNNHGEEKEHSLRQSSARKTTIDDVTVENLPQKSMMEENNNVKVSNAEDFQKKKDDIKFGSKQPHLQERPCKYDKRLPCENKEKNKKRDPDNQKYKKPKQHYTETEQDNKKHEGKYKNFKKMKEKRHNQRKELKKHHHYKYEKHFKRELYNTRRKNSHNMYTWDKDDDRRHSNVSGDWIIDMNRARAETRESEHRSDWLFERAHARKAKRNGKWDMDNWYFQRVDGRKYCRQKSGNEKSKISHPPPNDSEKEFHDKTSKRHQKPRKYFKPKSWISKAYMTLSKFRL